MSSNLLAANDVLDGFFAINGGAFGGKAGNVFYWVLCDDISKFYKLCH